MVLLLNRRYSVLEAAHVFAKHWRQRVMVRAARP
jgi:hypothetical protein